MGSFFFWLSLLPFSFLLLFIEVTQRPDRVLKGSLKKITGDGKWKKARPLPSYRYECCSAALGDDIYVVGGIFRPSVWFPTALVEVYHCQSDQWETISSYPVAAHHAGAATLDGKLYVVGGNGIRIVPRSDVFSYDPQQKIWERKADLPVARGALAVVSLNGKLYALGGGANKVALSTVDEYDPKTNIWTAKAKLPTPREHITAAVAGGKIYVIAGYAGTRFNNLTTLEAYDPTTNAWKTLAPVPYAVSGLASAVVADRLFIFGGEQGWATSAEVHEYLPENDTWVRHSDMPSARYALTATAVNGEIHAIGGNAYIHGTQFSVDHDVFLPRHTA